MESYSSKRMQCTVAVRINDSEQCRCQCALEAQPPARREGQNDSVDSEELPVPGGPGPEPSQAARGSDSQPGRDHWQAVHRADSDLDLGAAVVALATVVTPGRTL